MLKPWNTLYVLVYLHNAVTNEHLILRAVKHYADLNI
jgi:hypothetical protein